MEQKFSSVASGCDISPVTDLQTQDNQRTKTSPSSDTVDSGGISTLDEPWTYPFRKRKAGLFVIFNHEVFDNPTLPTREGTDIDKKGLKEVWENLGFSVVTYDDLTFAQITEKIQKYASESYHNEYDCFACAVMTHGDEQDNIHARDKSYHVRELFHPFRACESLVGKPKLFFIQACRGQEFDHGIKKVKSDAVDAKITEDTEPQKEEELTIPRESDFLIAYSTVEGYYAWRDKVQGSWFIQTLNDCIRRYAWKWDLMTVLTQVSREISYRQSSTNLPKYSGKKQCPSIVSRLTGLLYLYPSRQSDGQDIPNKSSHTSTSVPRMMTETSVFEGENESRTEENKYYRLKMEVLKKKKELIELKEKLCMEKNRRVDFFGPS